MDQADKRHSENEVLDEHRLAQVCTTAHKHCRDEVGNKWISESDTGVRRVFGWKVIAEGKARDHAQMERKIAEVVEQSGAEAVAVFDHGATEYFPEHDRRDAIEQDVANGSQLRLEKQTSGAAGGRVDIVLQPPPDSSIAHQREWTTTDHRAEQNGSSAQSDE